MFPLWKDNFKSNQILNLYNYTNTSKNNRITAMTYCYKLSEKMKVYEKKLKLNIIRINGITDILLVDFETI